MGVNRVFLLGNLGADPEMRYTPSQQPVCTLRLATGERRKNAEGQWVDHTEWHSVVTFGKTAENCSQFLAKGRQVFVEGRIQTNKWQDKEGKDRYKTEVIASAVQFVGGRGENAGIEKSYVPAKSKGASAEAPPYETGDIPIAQPISLDDDDIPF